MPVEGHATAPNAWTLRTPVNNIAPLARDHHAMTFDKATASLYVFGGRAHAGMDHAGERPCYAIPRHARGHMYGIQRAQDLNWLD